MTKATGILVPTNNKATAWKEPFTKSDTPMDVTVDVTRGKAGKNVTERGVSFHVDNANGECGFLNTFPAQVAKLLDAGVDVVAIIEARAKTGETLLVLPYSEGRCRLVLNYTAA